VAFETSQIATDCCRRAAQPIYKAGAVPIPARNLSRADTKPLLRSSAFGRRTVSGSLWSVKFHSRTAHRSDRRPPANFPSGLSAMGREIRELGDRFVRAGLTHPGRPVHTIQVSFRATWGWRPRSPPTRPSRTRVPIGQRCRQVRRERFPASDPIARTLLEEGACMPSGVVLSLCQAGHREGLQGGDRVPWRICRCDSWPSRCDPGVWQLAFVRDVGPPGHHTQSAQRPAAAPVIHRGGRPARPGHPGRCRKPLSWMNFRPRVREMSSAAFHRAPVPGPGQGGTRRKQAALVAGRVPPSGPGFLPQLPPAMSGTRGPPPASRADVPIAGSGLGGRCPRSRAPSTAWSRTTSR